MTRAALLVGLAITSFAQCPKRIRSGLLARCGISNQGRERFFFADTDAALEWAEDHLVMAFRGDMGTSDGVALKDFEICRHFSEQEIRVLEESLVKKCYKQNDVVSREGAPDRDLLFLTRGAVNISIGLSESGSDARVIGAEAAGRRRQRSMRNSLCPKRSV